MSVIRARLSAPLRQVRRKVLDAFRRLLGIQWVIDQIGVLRAEVHALHSNRNQDWPIIRQLDELRSLLDHVEVYQPIFRLGNQPALSGLGTPKRPCDDRIEAIKTSMDGNLKNVRILDAGSSLGYISFSLAQYGAQVVGLESSPQNVAASRLIGQITGVPATFHCGELDEHSIDQMSSNHFDIALFLSIFHHIVHSAGIDQARAMIRKILDKVPVCYFELALKEEDGTYPWKESLPENPLALFDTSELDLVLLGHFPTHLSDVRRPLYRVSRKSSITVNGKAYPCRRTLSKAYPESPVVTNRRYHFSDRFLIKEVFADSADSFGGIFQTVNEIGILQMIQRDGWPADAGIGFSSLVDFEISRQTVRLVLELAPGELLSNTVATLDEAQRIGVLERIERAAVHLEKRYGIYHNDLRLWNLMYDSKSNLLTLIDFGLGSRVMGEGLWLTLAWLAAELDQERILSLEARRSLHELENVPWRSPELHQRFERYKCRSEEALVPS